MIKQLSITWQSQQISAIQLINFSKFFLNQQFECVFNRLNHCLNQSSTLRIITLLQNLNMASKTHQLNYWQKNSAPSLDSRTMIQIGSTMNGDRDLFFRID
ncbi:unnamed protein product [Paramecium sonneborni]|uniref:Uncharacterized protein n=1 Tax=Paramecium sonneborni TaxID=65129 RepID=A0A8S1QW35_9CILI|nr:unnamed protein product [Paramecium sonneborni]